MDATLMTMENKLPEVTDNFKSAEETLNQIYDVYKEGSVGSAGKQFAQGAAYVSVGSAGVLGGLYMNDAHIFPDGTQVVFGALIAVASGLVGACGIIYPIREGVKCLAKPFRKPSSEVYMLPNGKLTNKPTKLEKEDCELVHPVDDVADLEDMVGKTVVLNGLEIDPICRNAPGGIEDKSGAWFQIYDYVNTRKSGKLVAAYVDKNNSQMMAGVKAADSLYVIGKVKEDNSGNIDVFMVGPAKTHGLQ